MFRSLLKIGIFGILFCSIAMFLGLFLDVDNQTISETINLLKQRDMLTETIIYQIRLPRVLLALLVGASLSVGGATFQAVFKNPLAEPYILGISGGASVGMILGILMGLSPLYLDIYAFIGSIVTLLLILSLGKWRYNMESLLLTGVMISAFSSALILFLMSLSDANQLFSIMYWFMGDLSSASMQDIKLLACFILPICLIVWLLGYKMNILLLGNDLAKNSGISPTRLAIFLLTIISITVAVTVTTVGAIGFVGLVVPQALRRIFGADHRKLIPACTLFGAAYLAFCDVLSRSIPIYGELPTGVITGLIGAPFFIVLLRKKI